MKHILIIGSYAPSILNFRLPLIKEFLKKNHKVSVALGNLDEFNLIKLKLSALNVKTYSFPISRSGLNFFKDFKTLLKINEIIQNCNPNVILAYTAKPVVYTGIVLKKFPNIMYYPLITGLGYAFTDVSSIRRYIIKSLMIKLYKLSIHRSKKTIFQNKDDKKLFDKLKITKKSSSSVVNGTGVDLRLYPFSPLPSAPVFLMMSRLILEKGLIEYFQSARIVKSKYPNAIFQLAGRLDDNPSSITLQILKHWIKKKDIKYLGEIKNVQSILKSCKYFVLPSYYREGVPRSTLEALSTGRPVITTDVPGCRETVINNKNGLLIPSKDSQALADAMIKLLLEKDEVIKKMARESYMMAKNKFDVNIVNKNMINIMNL